MGNDSKMIGKTVVFYSNGDETIGVIEDLLNIPITSGSNQYVPMDNYLIVDSSGAIHIINPIDLISVVREIEQHDKAPILGV